MKSREGVEGLPARTRKIRVSVNQKINPSSTVII
jgi:hypothetical protein